MSETIIHKWAMILNLIAGICFALISLSSLGAMKSSCTSKVINNGMNIILGIGAILLTLAIVYFSCSGDGLDCYDVGAPQVASMYLTITIIISIVVLAISGLMYKEVKKINPEECGKHTKVMVILLMTISIVILAISGISLVRVVNVNDVQDYDEDEDDTSKPRMPGVADDLRRLYSRGSSNSLGSNSLVFGQ